MKQEYKMTKEEMDVILQINKDHVNMPVMKMFSGSDSKQEKINNYWEHLASKYGFEDQTVEGSSRSDLHFLAKPELLSKRIEVDCRYCRGSGKSEELTTFKYTIEKDGDAWCCYGEGFEDLQTSDNYAFGNTPREAMDKFLEEVK